MTPTTRLRFVIRWEGEREVRILQQWWEDQSTGIHWVSGNPGEWRDVPLEPVQ